MTSLLGLPIYEIIVPATVWTMILVHHIWLVRSQHVFSHHFDPDQAPSTYTFFSVTREDYVRQNHLTGQATANSTRDYLRVLLFYTGNSVLIATIVGGYCASSYDPNGSPQSILLTVKLGVISVLFFVIFFVMIYAVRYGTHFHMMMNVKIVNGHVLKDKLSIISKVYHKSHFFYSTGVRMHFLLIPAFCWVMSCWLMLAISPVYLYLITQYDDLSWLQEDIDQLFNKNQDGTDDEEGVRMIQGAHNSV